MLGAAPLAATPLASGPGRSVFLLRMVGVRFAQHFGVLKPNTRVHLPTAGKVTKFGVITFKRRHSLAELLAQITPNVSLQEQPRAFNLTYGDGYFSDMPDGLYAMTRTLTLVWDGIPESEIQMLMNYFNQTAGTAIIFRPPREKTPRKWITQQLKRTKPYPDAGALTAMLIEKVP